MLHAQFGPEVLIAGNVPYEMHARMESVDLDGDGDLDLVFISNAGLVWAQNLDGEGTFGTAVVLAPEVVHYTVGDLDADGDADVVFVDDLGQLMWVANLDGLGTFGAPQLVAMLGVAAEAITCTDLNGDGLPDVALILNAADDAVVQVFINTGGAFAAPLVLPFGVPGSGLRLLDGDIDLDGNVDLLTLDGDGVVRVLLNEDGDASAWNSVEVGETEAGARLQLIDVDGDGDLDLIQSAWVLLQWAENTATPGNVPPFVVHEVATDGVVNHFGHAVHLGCGPHVAITHYQGLAGHIFWTFFDPDEMAFVTPYPSITIFEISPGPLASADLNGDGREDLLCVVPGTGLVWFANELPEEPDPEGVAVVPFDTLCAFDGPYTLDQASPPDGLWSGPGVESNTFHPDITGVGSFTLTYRVSAPCPMDAEVEIVVEDPSAWYADQDEDGLGDPDSLVHACSQPDGFVENNDDICPLLAFLEPGDPCDDGDPETENTFVDESCECVLGVSVQELTGSPIDLVIFPNPSPGFFTLSVGDQRQGPIEVAVYNSQGHQVHAPFRVDGISGHYLDMQGHANGLYFLRAVSHGRVQVHEIMIQR